MFSRRRNEKAAGVILLLLSVIFIIRSFTLCTGQDIWYDELFTIEFVTKPFSEMIKLIASDVHPPLYYLIVRAGVVTAKAIAPQLSAITAAKAMSCLPYVMIFLYAVIFIRKEFGLLTAGLFSICTMAMPQMSDYMVEVRMYSWALFFVTAAAIHGYMIVKVCAGFRDSSDMLKEGRSGRSGLTANALMLTIFSAAACYTHYYACIAAVCIYMLLIIWMIFLFVNNTRRKSSRKLSFAPFGAVLISMNAVALSYIPWIGVVFSQTGRVADNYWIQPLTIRSIGGCIKFLFKPAFTSEWLSSAVAGINLVIFAVTVITAVHFAFGKSKATDNKVNLEQETKPDTEDLICKREYKRNLQCEFGIFCILIMAGLIVTGFIASVLIRPVFVYRYMLPACGVFWLGFSVMAGIVFDHAMTSSQKNMSTQSTLSSQSNQSTQSPQSSESTQSTQSPQSSESTQSSQSTQSTQSPQSSESTQSTQSTQSSQSAQSTKSSRTASVEHTRHLAEVTMIYVSVIIIVVTCIRDYYSFRGNELYKNVQMDNTQENLDRIDQDTIVICNFLQVQALYAYYEGGCYLYGSEPEPLIPEMLSGIEVIDDDLQIKNWIDDGKKVIFLGSFNSREEIIQNWNDKYGIVAVDTGSCMLERYWFDIYVLS